MKVITPKARLSYPHLFEPQIPPGQTDPVYSCTLIFEDGTDLADMRKAVDVVGREKWADKWEAAVKAGKVRLPFREDGEEKGYPEGSVFINIKSKAAPGVVSIYPGPDGKPKAIDNPTDVYAGCYVRASLRAFAYDVNGNKGVSFALGNVQKVGDGQRLDGRSRAEDEFQADPNAGGDVDLDDL